MKLGIRLRIAILLFLDICSAFDRNGAIRYRSTHHNWIQKADTPSSEAAGLNHVAVDKTVIQLDDERYWLYASVDADTNHLLQA